MGRPEKFTPATRQLRLLLEEAREEGLTFEEAWERSVRPGVKLITTNTPDHERPPACVIWPADTRDRQVIRTITLEQRPTWERSYEGIPATPAELALVKLASELRLDDFDDEPLFAAAG